MDLRDAQDFHRWYQKERDATSEMLIARQEETRIMREYTVAQEEYMTVLRAKRADALAAEKVRLKARTPEGDCPCEGCVLLRTDMGATMLTWLRTFLGEITEIVTKERIPPSTPIQLTFDGPTGAQILGIPGGYAKKKYTAIDTTVGDVAAMTRASIIMQTPDFGALREAYADDPVTLALIDWIEKRTA